MLQCAIVLSGPKLNKENIDCAAIERITLFLVVLVCVLFSHFLVRSVSVSGYFEVFTQNFIILLFIFSIHGQIVYCTVKMPIRFSTWIPVNIDQLT